MAESFFRASASGPSHCGSGLFIDDDQEVDFWTLPLNTALAVGGDFLTLAARLHGQCETHAFVEGQNRAWLAGIIERGLQSNLLNPNKGWEDVVELLRLSMSDPVVTSYSTSNTFPNREVAMESAEWRPLTQICDDENEDEAWSNLPKEKQWRLALEGLRARNHVCGGQLELKPQGWEDFRLGAGMSAFDIMRYFKGLAAMCSG